MTSCQSWTQLSFPFQIKKTQTVPISGDKQATSNVLNPSQNTPVINTSTPPVPITASARVNPGDSFSTGQDSQSLESPSSPAPTNSLVNTPSPLPTNSKIFVPLPTRLTASLLPSTLRLSRVGDTGIFRIQIIDENGDFMEPNQFTIVWSSEHPDIIAINQEGEVTVLQTGFATITATLLEEPGVIATGTVFVDNSGDSSPPVTGNTVNVNTNFN